MWVCRQPRPPRMPSVACGLAQRGDQRALADEFCRKPIGSVLTAALAHGPAEQANVVDQPAKTRHRRSWAEKASRDALLEITRKDVREFMRGNRGSFRRSQFAERPAREEKNCIVRARADHTRVDLVAFVVGQRRDRQTSRWQRCRTTALITCKRACGMPTRAAKCPAVRRAGSFASAPNLIPVRAPTLTLHTASVNAARQQAFRGSAGDEGRPFRGVRGAGSLIGVRAPERLSCPIAQRVKSEAGRSPRRRPCLRPASVSRRAAPHP